MKRFITHFILLLSMLLSCSAFGWSANAHKIVAAIAYDNLTPQAKRVVDQLTTNMFYSHYGFTRFLAASVWPDQIKSRGITAFNNWHYVNLPYSQQGVKGTPLSKENAAWAIQQSEKVLHSRRADIRMKAMFLSFLVHFVGDIHQPLHCFELFNKRFPHGDIGGNLFKINYRGIHNLHSYWDSGAGLFHNPRYMNYRKVQGAAYKIMKLYPQSYFGGRIQDMDPYTWARNSYNLAIKYGYTGVTEGEQLTSKYQAKAHKVVKTQIALAGYRLATILNNLYTKGGKQ